MAIIDANGSVGGVWSKQNVFPSLKTYNLRGTIEYADFPTGDDFGVRANEHVPGLVMHQYLTAYAERWRLMAHVKFNTAVKIIKKINEKTGVK